MRLLKPLTNLFLCTILLCGCSETKKPLTAEEVKNFARELESSVNKKNPVVFDNAMDRKEILRRAGISDPKAGESMNLGKGIVSVLSRDGSFKLIKQYQENGTWHLLYRLYFNKIMALNYYDLELSRRGGQVKIADGYTYNVGQRFSEMFKDLYQQMDEVADNANENKDKWLDQIPVMRNLVMNGQFDEAYKTFEKIPADVRQIKLMQIIHVMICSGINAETHRAALQEYKNLYPNDPNIALLQVSGYMLLHDYENCLHAVEELDRILNKDPLLDYHRSICYKMLKKPGQQINCLFRLSHNMPDFEDGILELIAAYLEEKNNTEADKWIKEFRLHGSFDQDRLETLLLPYSN